MEHRITPEQNGETLHVRSGDTVVLQLKENPTTGYLWEMDEAAPFTIEQSDYALPAESGTGGGGTRTFVLRITEAGTHELIFRKRQRWSGEVHQTFRLMVRCE